MELILLVAGALVAAVATRAARWIALGRAREAPELIGRDEVRSSGRTSSPRRRS